MSQTLSWRARQHSPSFRLRAFECKFKWEHFFFLLFFISKIPKFRPNLVSRASLQQVMLNSSFNNYLSKLSRHATQLCFAVNKSFLFLVQSLHSLSSSFTDRKTYLRKKCKWSISNVYPFWLLNMTFSPVLQ